MSATCAIPWLDGSPETTQIHRTFLESVRQRCDRIPMAIFINRAITVESPLTSQLRSLPGNLLHQLAWLCHIDSRAILGIFDINKVEWIFTKLTALGLDACDTCSDTNPYHRHGNLVADDGSDDESPHDHLVVVSPVIFRRGKLARFRHMLVSRSSWESLLI